MAKKQKHKPKGRANGKAATPDAVQEAANLKRAIRQQQNIKQLSRQLTRAILSGDKSLGALRTWLDTRVETLTGNPITAARDRGLDDRR